MKKCIIFGLISAGLLLSAFDCETVDPDKKNTRTTRTSTTGSDDDDDRPDEGESIDEGKRASLVDCQNVSEENRKKAVQNCDLDRSIQSDERTIKGCSLYLFKLIDAPTWGEGKNISEISYWLNAQKAKQLKEKLNEFSGVKDMIQKADIELAKAVYCLNEKTIKNAIEKKEEFLKDIKLSCKERMTKKGQGFDDEPFVNCRYEYMSIFLDAKKALN